MKQAMFPLALSKQNLTDALGSCICLAKYYNNIFQIPEHSHKNIYWEVRDKIFSKRHEYNVDWKDILKFEKENFDNYNVLLKNSEIVFREIFENEKLLQLLAKYSLIVFFMRLTESWLYESERKISFMKDVVKTKLNYCENSDA